MVWYLLCVASSYNHLSKHVIRTKLHSIHQTPHGPSCVSFISIPFCTLQLFCDQNMFGRGQNIFGRGFGNFHMRQELYAQFLTLNFKKFFMAWHFATCFGPIYPTCLLIIILVYRLGCVHAYPKPAYHIIWTRKGMAFHHMCTQSTTLTTITSCWYLILQHGVTFTMCRIFLQSPQGTCYLNKTLFNMSNSSWIKSCLIPFYLAHSAVFSYFVTITFGRGFGNFHMQRERALSFTSYTIISTANTWVFFVALFLIH